MNADAVVFGILLAGLPVNKLPQGSRATVCLATPIPAADALTFERGELIASKVLQLADFRLDWRDYGKPGLADRDPILLTVLSTTPKDYFPGAFGVSWPFEGVHTQSNILFSNLLAKEDILTLEPRGHFHFALTCGPPALTCNHQGCTILQLKPEIGSNMSAGPALERVTCGFL
jgi:hypothetical protein